MRARSHTRTHTHTHTHTHALTHTHTHTDVYTDQNTHARTHARTHACTHAHMQAHTRAHLQTTTQARAQTRTGAHTRAQLCDRSGPRTAALGGGRSAADWWCAQDNGGAVYMASGIVTFQEGSSITGTTAVLVAQRTLFVAFMSHAPLSTFERP